MKKAVSLILAFLLLASSLTACSESKENGDASAQSQTGTVSAEPSADAETEPEEEEPLLPEPDIPADADWGGEDFTIIYPGWSLYEFYLHADELNGDVMNDVQLSAKSQNGFRG